MLPSGQMFMKLHSCKVLYPLPDCIQYLVLNVLILGDIRVPTQLLYPNIIENFNSFS